MKKLLLLPILFIAFACSSDETDENIETTESLFDELHNEFWNFKGVSELEDSQCYNGCYNGFGFKNDNTILYVDFYGGADECGLISLSNLKIQENIIEADATIGTNSFGKLTFKYNNDKLTVSSIGGFQDFDYELVKESESLSSLCN